MNIPVYLERINYAGTLAPDLEVLSALQRAHLLAVPFENLDIQRHIKIDLENGYDKIVLRRRGGFCYELNGLFYALLKQVGFEVMMVSACVYDGKTGYSPEFDHMALVVKLNNQQYLVDVGFGEFSLEPILLELNAVTHDTAGDFIISQYDEQYLLVSKPDAAGKPAPEYIFSLQERSIAAFYDRCLFHQQSNESHFTQKRICSLPTIDGRITLTGNTLKITKSGIIREQVLKDEKEVEDVLWNYFGISL